MNAKHKSWLLLLGLICALTTARSVSADDGALQNPALKRFYSELQMLFRKEYPEVTSDFLKDEIHFEFNTRVFIVHESDMTGRWQDPSEERGPNPGGILCDITLKSGHYDGQIVVPQTFDERYFKVLVLAPNSAKQDKYLLVHLYYPQNVSPDFLKRFTELINDFDNMN